MANIFVGNLSFAATQEDVRKLFEKFGTVASVVMVKGKKAKGSRNIMTWAEKGCFFI